MLLFKINISCDATQVSVYDRYFDILAIRRQRIFLSAQIVIVVIMRYVPVLFAPRFAPCVICNDMPVIARQ